MMTNSSPHAELIREIDGFLAKTGMGASYFGKASCGNSEVVSRLKAGRKVWPDTEARIRSFIAGRSGSLACPVNIPANAPEYKGADT